MDDLSIRDRVPADLKRCISVLADVHRLDRYPLNWPADPYQWLSPDNTRHAWIAERGAAVVGHVVVHHHAAFATDPASPTVAEVGRLFVAPAARRHNTATQLLHHARQWAAEHQLDLTLEIVDDTRSAAAIALYERTGWRHTHTTTAAWTSPRKADPYGCAAIPSAKPCRRRGLRAIRSSTRTWSSRSGHRPVGETA